MYRRPGPRSAHRRFAKHERHTDTHESVPPLKKKNESVPYSADRTHSDLTLPTPRVAEVSVRVSSGAGPGTTSTHRHSQCRWAQHSRTRGPGDAWAGAAGAWVDGAALARPCCRRAGTGQTFLTGSRTHPPRSHTTSHHAPTSSALLPVSLFSRHPHPASRSLLPRARPSF